MITNWILTTSRTITAIFLSWRKPQVLAFSVATQNHQSIFTQIAGSLLPSLTQTINWMMTTHFRLLILSEKQTRSVVVAFARFHFRMDPLHLIDSTIAFF
jgi:hypothetical protein